MPGTGEMLVSWARGVDDYMRKSYSLQNEGSGMKEMRNGGGEELQPNYRDGRESAVGQGPEHVSWRKVTRKGPGAGGACSRLGDQCG